MLTFSPLAGTGVSLSTGSVTLAVFAPDRKPGDGKKTLSLLSTPEETDVPGTLSWPGEYNELGVTVKGIGQLEGQQVSYVVDAEETRVLFLSEPLQDWSDTDLESVGDIDVLVAPVSDSKILQKLVDEFDPRALVLVPSKGASTSVMSALGGKGEPVAEYKLKGSLPVEGREVVVLAK